jgi:hypothetical protein
MLSVVMLNVKKNDYAECRYSVCRYNECRYAECRFAECRYAECRSAENSDHHLVKNPPPIKVCLNIIDASKRLNTFVPGIHNVQIKFEKNTQRKEKCSAVMLSEILFLC